MRGWSIVMGDAVLFRPDGGTLPTAKTGFPSLSTSLAGAATKPLPCVYVSRWLIQLRWSERNPDWSTSRAATM